jgi:hypothetical protein
MPTPAEYRHLAELLLRLAAEATEVYAREELLELAAEFRRAAARLEGGRSEPS